VTSKLGGALYSMARGMAVLGHPDEAIRTHRIHHLKLTMAKIK
jgi:hypothetical protein